MKWSTLKNQCAKHEWDRIQNILLCLAGPHGFYASRKPSSSHDSTARPVLLTKISNLKNADFRSSNCQRHQNSNSRSQRAESLFLESNADDLFNHELQLSAQISLSSIQTESGSFHEDQGPPESEKSALCSPGVYIDPQADRGVFNKEASCPAYPQGLSMDPWILCMDPSPRQTLQTHNPLFSPTKRQSLSTYGLQCPTNNQISSPADEILNFLKHHIHAQPGPPAFALHPAAAAVANISRCHPSPNHPQNRKNLDPLAIDGSFDLPIVPQLDPGPHLPPAKACDCPHGLAGTGRPPVLRDAGPKRPTLSDQGPPATAASTAAAEAAGQGQAPAVGFGGVSNCLVFAAGASAFRRVGPQADRRGAGHGPAIASRAVGVGAGGCWGGF